jgi:hypothetical protein
MPPCPGRCLLHIACQELGRSLNRWTSVLHPLEPDASMEGQVIERGTMAPHGHPVKGDSYGEYVVLQSDRPQLP